LKYQVIYGGYMLADNFEYQTDITIEEPYTSRYIWLTRNGLLLIRKGYLWDGPSGPTLDDRQNMVPSLIHDALYELIRLGVLSKEYKKKADYILKIEMTARADKWYKYPIRLFYKARALYYYYGVKWFGWFACEPKKDGEEPEIIEVE